MSHDFEGDLAKQIETKQQESVVTLIQKLGPQAMEEDNLNACSIIQDMLEIKEFYAILSKKANMQQIIEYAFTHEQRNCNSQNAALGVLNTLVQLYHEKHKNGEGRKQGDGNNEDEDDIIIQQSDEEDEEGKNAFIDLLKQVAKNITQYLEEAVPKVEIPNSYESRTLLPLGPLRLKIVELVHLLLKLNKTPIIEALADTEIFSKVSDLVKQYPWNNFLQLKTISIYEEVLDTIDDKTRGVILKKSNIGQTILKLASRTTYSHESNRTIRHGYMALIIKLANLLQKHTDKPEVKEYIDALGDEWKSFVEGELKQSNILNTRSLGGQQPRSSQDDEDESNQYEVNMEKIMARFSNFNSVLSQSSSADNEDEEEEEEQRHEEEHKEEEEKPKTPEKGAAATMEL